MSNPDEENPVGVTDEQLPEDLRPSEDNPLAEGLPPGETADDDLLEGGKRAEQSDDDAAAGDGPGGDSAGATGDEADV